MEHGGTSASRAATVARNRARRVTVAAAAVTGLGLAAFAVTAVLEVRQVDWTSPALLPAYVFACLLVLGELRPLLVAREDGDTDTVTVSTTFAVALVITGPLLLAMVAQALAVGYDDVRRRRPLLKTGFNVGQYLLTLTASRLVFCLLSGRHVLDVNVPISPHDVLPGLVAGATFFVVNNGLVAVIVAVATGRNPLGIVLGDVRAQGLASSILVALAPLSAIAADFSLLTVPLVVLPLLGVQHSADLAARRQYEALHDGLTRLPNRTLLHRRAEAAVTDAVRAHPPGSAVPPDADDLAAVMLLDLDHFKEVNDTLGHHVGDALLREVAARVGGLCPDDVTVSRLGGDEFAVLMPRTGVDEAAALAARICEALRRPAVVDGVRVAMQSSIGVALAPLHATTVEGLLQRADIALYRAKDVRGTLELYHEEFDTHTVQRLNLAADLNTAVEADQMSLAYQPLVEASTRRIVALEALLRWTHPTLGPVSPGEFIPLAERSGAISTLSYYVLDRALLTARELQRHGHALSMSVNLSARLLTDLALPDAVADALFRCDVAPRLLTIEVTESTIAADPKRAMDVLQELRAMGVRLSVDDFGTGYSSLAYLSRLQPDELKVDRSFVQAMVEQPREEAIVRSTIELGHSLGIEVTAEGVEDEEVYERLLALGCDRVQGYLFGRPLPEPQLRGWLEAAPAADDDARLGTVAS